MVALRAGPDGGFAPLALAVLIFLLTPTSAGYQDLGSLIAQQPQVAAHWHEHRIASPFGTIHASMFSLPRPLGTGMPDPAGFRLARFESRDGEITGSVQPVALREMPDPDPIVFPEVDRSHKGDLLVPRPQPRQPEEAARTEPLPDELQAALNAPALPQEAPLGPEPDPASANPEASIEGRDAPDLSILDAAADPDPAARTAQLFFGGPAGTRLGAIEPWAQGEEPILMLPRRPVDSDIKLSALTPSATDPRTDAGVTIAGKGEVTGEGRRPKSPAERLGLDDKARAKAEKCLANAVYFEARGESVRGQIAVAQVVMNRVFSGYYPNDVCGVVYQNAHRHLACQFTFACDGRSKAIHEPDAMERARRIATATLDGRLWLPEVGKATHYHAYWVHPWWVRTMHKLYRVGVHTFYRPRRWGDGADAPSWGSAQMTAEAAAKL
jgi:hypothetical protein